MLPDHLDGFRTIVLASTIILSSPRASEEARVGPRHVGMTST